MGTRKKGGQSPASASRSKYVSSESMDAVQVWLQEHSLELRNIPPDIWGQIHNNVQLCREVAGVTVMDVADRIGCPLGTLSANLRSRNLGFLLRIAEVLQWNPNIILMGQLRQRLIDVVNKRAAKSLTYEDSVFASLPFCGVCKVRGADPDAKFCSRCGARIVPEASP